MAGLNKVMLIGNLGKDPEVKTLDNGAKIATFPLATSENYKDKEGNRQTRTEWHNLVLWRGLADIAENYLHKGSQVFVEGRLSTRKWEDKEGHTRYTTEVIGDNLVLLNKNSDPLNIALNSSLNDSNAQTHVTEDQNTDKRDTTKDLSNQDSLESKNSEINDFQNDSGTKVLNFGTEATRAAQINSSPANSTQTESSTDDLPF